MMSGTDALQMSLSPNVNTQQTRHRDSNRASARPAALTRSLDVRSPGHVCWRVDEASCRNTTSARIPDMFSSAPTGPRSSRTRRTHRELDV